MNPYFLVTSVVVANAHVFVLLYVSYLLLEGYLPCLGSKLY